jgi:hypothetical protein
MSPALIRLYGAARASVSDGSTVAGLWLDAEQTWMVIGDGATPAQTLALAPGWRTVAAGFRDRPPSALDLEEAIAVVEDRLQPALLRAPALPPRWFAADATLAGIARVAGTHLGQPPRLLREPVEQAFEQLAAVSMGRPARGGEQVLLDPVFAARLLILRELMHHAAAMEIELLPQALLEAVR